MTPRAPNATNQAAAVVSAGPRPLGAAPGGPAAAHRPRPFRRRHRFPHQLHMRVVRSPYAHAGLLAVDTSAARAMPGVVAVWTGDRPRRSAADRFSRSRAEALRPIRQPVLAQDRCAMSASRSLRCSPTDAYLAEDAADLVDDRDRGAAAGPRPRAIRPASSRRASRPSRSCCSDSYGDLDAAFARARTSSRSTSPSAAIPACRSRRAARSRATTRARDVLELLRRGQGAAPQPRHALRACSAAARRRCMLKEGHTGGGFGIRGELYPEDLLVCVAALRLRPAGQMDRGPARASDGGQPFARAAPSCARRGRCGGPRAGSTTSSSTTRAPMSAPTARACPR